MTDTEYERIEEERMERRQICSRISEMAPWLAEDVAACMEAAYRRGIQQGAILNASDDLNADWRFKPFGNSDRYRLSTNPPNGSGPTQSALKRHSSEARNVSGEVANILDSGLQQQGRDLNND